MSIYMTEEEQLQVMKSWWKRYGSLITVLFSVILLTISGFKYWNWHEEKVVQQASNTYEHLMLAFSNQDNKGVRGYANQLLTDYGQTVYADAARLTLAKLYIARTNYARAREELAHVAEHSKMSALQQVAKIRLARLLAVEKSYDSALDELDTVQDTAYLPTINELKGDINAAVDRNKEAIAFYSTAIKEFQTKGLNNLFLEMKANELAAQSVENVVTNIEATKNEA